MAWGAGIAGAQGEGGRHFLYPYPAWQRPRLGNVDQGTSIPSPKEVRAGLDEYDWKDGCPEEGALERGLCRACKSLPGGQRRVGFASWDSVAGT